VQLEGLGKLKKKIHLVGTRTRDLSACSAVSQPSTIPSAPNSYINLLFRRNSVWVETSISDFSVGKGGWRAFRDPLTDFYETYAQFRIRSLRLKSTLSITHYRASNWMSRHFSCCDLLLCSRVRKELSVSTITWPYRIKPVFRVAVPDSQPVLTDAFIDFGAPAFYNSMIQVSS
jgi:hypothetical protein